MQEPISGKLEILPPSPISHFVQRKLNNLRDPGTELARHLEDLRSMSFLRTVDRLARASGWEPVQSFKPRPSLLKTLFKSSELYWSFYKPPHWGCKWVLAVTTNQHGDKWWVAETQHVPEKPTPEDFAQGRIQPLRRALAIGGSSVGDLVFNASFASLFEVQRAGAGLISELLDCRELISRSVPYKQRPSISASRFHVPDLFIRYDESNILKQIPASVPKAWFHDTLKSSFAGFVRIGRLIRTLVFGRLRQAIPRIHTVTESGHAVAFHPDDGRFVFRFTHPVDQSSVPNIVESLASIRNLLSFIDTARKYDLSCSHVSLTDFRFGYNSQLSDLSIELSHRTFKAQVDFPPEKGKQISFGEGNPHLQINDFLAIELNKSLENGFSNVAGTMMTTLPLLRCLSSLGDLHRTARKGVNLRVLPRSGTCYGVRYDCESHQLQYEICLRFQHDQPVWHAKLAHAGSKEVSVGSWLGKSHSIEAKASPGRAKPNGASSRTNLVPKHATKTESETDVSDSSRKSIQQVWQRLAQRRGQGWSALGLGFLAQFAGVEGWVRAIDEAVCEFLEDDGTAFPTADGHSNQMPTTEPADPALKPGNAAAKAMQLNGSSSEMAPAPKMQVVELD